MGELSSIQFHVSPELRTYTGVELRPHFLLSELKIRGSAICAFRGATRVETEHLVDWEDRLEHDRIEAREMVHFLGEFFGMSLSEGVLTQRLFMASCLDTLNELLAHGGSSNALRRTGDDLWLGERKLSVSIVTATPVSVLMHVGINVDPYGAPVPAIGLTELGVDPGQFIAAMFERFSKEWEDMKWACTKVRPMV